MLCPCCGNRIALGARECGCGARFVGEPLDEAPIQVQRLGPAMAAVVLFAVVVCLALTLTKWLAFAGVAVVWAARRAMRLARAEPAGYGGYRTATATLAVTIIAGAGASLYAGAHVPQFLEYREIRKRASTQADIYHLYGLLENYKRTYGSYPPNIQEFKKITNEPLPTDYWERAIKYQSYPAAIADAKGSATTIHLNNFELRSAGPDGEDGTDDDIIMRDGVFLTKAEASKQPFIIPEVTKQPEAKRRRQ